MASTAQTTINSTTFTSLGLAPVQVQCLGPGPVTIVVADSTPSVGTQGFVLQVTNPPTIFDPADASSNVYAAMFGGVAAMIAYNIVSSQTS